METRERTSRDGSHVNSTASLFSCPADRFIQEEPVIILPSNVELLIYSSVNARRNFYLLKDQATGKARMVYLGIRIAT